MNNKSQMNIELNRVVQKWSLNHPPLRIPPSSLDFPNKQVIYELAGKSSIFLRVLRTRIHAYRKDLGVRDAEGAALRDIHDAILGNHAI